MRNTPLTAYTPCFVAETLKSGISTNPVGQAEAERAVGLTFGQTLSQVVLPQAFRTVIPPLGSVSLAVPKGQRKAAMAISLRPGQAMRRVLMPQALRAMMPTIIAQIVVLLEDSALGFILTYQDLLYQVNLIGCEYNNLLPTFLAGGVLFIIINMIVAGIARLLEKRLQRKATAPVGAEGLSAKTTA